MFSFADWKNILGIVLVATPLFSTSRLFAMWWKHESMKHMLLFALLSRTLLPQVFQLMKCIGVITILKSVEFISSVFDTLCKKFVLNESDHIWHPTPPLFPLFPLFFYKSSFWPLFWEKSSFSSFLQKLLHNHGETFYN